MVSSAVLAMRKHLSVSDHKPGRLRVRIALAATLGADARALSELRSQFENGKAIRKFKFSPLTLSMAIDYDPEAIPPETWRIFLDGSDEEATRAWEKVTA